MYSISDYGRMFADCNRTKAYLEALRQVITADSVVLEIGTGVGIMSILACQLGARRVYAVEPDACINVARQIAADCGLDGKIKFIQGLSTEISLPERAHVIFSDLRGVLPLFQQHLPAIVDARRRLLAPNGVLIPRRDTLWASVVEAPAVYEHYLEPWQKNDYGMDLTRVGTLVTNTWRRARVKPEDLLTEPLVWATLDYYTLDDPDVRGSIECSVKRPGLGHGMNVWFDAELAPQLTFSNSPAAPDSIYGAAFFPWPRPVNLVTGDVVRLSIAADLVGEDYVWRWNTRVFEQGEDRLAKAQFKQSTFLSTPLFGGWLTKAAANFVPSRSEKAEIERFILTSMDGQKSLETIAQQLLVQFPDHFAGFKEALTAVGQSSVRYSE